MKKRFAASAMILAMSAATVLSPLTTFAEAEEQELNIAIFQGGYGDAYWNQMVELFEASHEGVKVNMTISPTIGDIIRPQIVAGNAPDFICLNDGGEDGVILSLIKEHALLNLDDVFDGENYAGTGTLRDDITDGILSSTKCAPYGDDEIYLAPFNSGPQGLIYNKTFFDENNLEVPKTWDEFFTLGDTLKDIDGRALFTYQGIYPGYMEEMLWPAIANECGEEALTKIANYEEGSFNNEGVLKALTHIKEIAEKGYLLEGTVGMNHTESQTEMMLGKAAFITNGTWMEMRCRMLQEKKALSLQWPRSQLRTQMMCIMYSTAVSSSPFRLLQRIRSLQKNSFVSCTAMNLYLHLQKLPVPFMQQRVPVK